MSNLIQDENAKTGNSDWELTAPATFPNPEIEGYASLCSVNRGGSIDLFVNVKDTGTYRIDTYRMGWYGGAGARLVDTRTGITGVQQVMPSFDLLGMKECAWTSPQTINIPSSASDWTSGVYVSRLTKTSGTGINKQSFIIFTVRDDDRASKYLFQSSVTTWNAYNRWGGRSLYTATQARSVSFDRPYGHSIASETHAEWRTGLGAGEFFVNLLDFNKNYGCGGEYNLVRWLEKEGYDVSYSTNIDTHTSGGQLLIHDYFFTVFHDEYISTAMRANIQAAINAGVYVWFNSANTIYWHTRHATGASGRLNGTMICYKQFAPTDPDPEYPSNETSNLWAGSQVAQPEGSIMGVAYDGFQAFVNEDLVITNPSHWMFEGTGFTQDQVIADRIAGEVDRAESHAPAGTVTLSHSPISTSFSDMRIYQAPAPSLAWVWSTGQFCASWWLDNYNGPSTTNLRPDITDANLEQVVKNFLAKTGGTSSALGLEGKLVVTGQVVFE